MLSRFTAMRKLRVRGGLGLCFGLLGLILTACTHVDTLAALSPTSLQTTPQPWTDGDVHANLPANIQPVLSLQKLHAVPGLNVWLYEQDPTPVTGWLNDLNVHWIRHQLPWNEIETAPGVYDWTRVDKMVSSLRASGNHVMLNPVHTPSWACGCQLGLPRNAADFGRFMTQVAQRYKGQVEAYEIWNEPNLAQEAGKPISVANYVHLLEAGYTAIKAVDPTAIVVSGGMTPTGVNDPNLAIDDVTFLRSMYAYNNGEVKRYFDVLGAHPGSTLNPPQTLWPDLPGPGPGWRDHPSFYFRRIEQIRQVMVDAGDGQKMVWLTEFGWASTPNPAPGFGHAAYVSEAQQARYIADALAMGRDKYPWMGVMFLFQLNFALPTVAGNPDDERVAWGIIRRDGTKRPSYTSLRDFAHALAP